MQAQDLERLARRRAAMKLGWWIHAMAYAAVNLLLAGLAAASGRHWAVYPALGWGLGLTLHGLVVFVLLGGGLHQRLVERERERLAAMRQPR